MPYFASPRILINGYWFPVLTQWSQLVLLPIKISEFKWNEVMRKNINVIPQQNTNAASAIINFIYRISWHAVLGGGTGGWKQFVDMSSLNLPSLSYRHFVTHSTSPFPKTVRNSRNCFGIGDLGWSVDVASETVLLVCWAPWDSLVHWVLYC